MYEHISGQLKELNPAYAVLECNGVGYLLNISLYTYTSLADSNASEETCRLYAHLIVREDALTLYGFINQEEREHFRQLILVNGVGANTARMILSSLTPDELTDSIINEQVNTLKQVKGIGAKTAQRIILDLKDKLKKESPATDILSSEHNTQKNEALSALAMLGFQEGAAEQALNKVLKSMPADTSVEHIIKETLKSL